MKKSKRLLGLACAVVLLLTIVSFAACGEPEVVLDSITLNTTESKTVYNVGERYSSEGVVVTAKYSDGTSVDVTADSTFTQPNMTASGSIEVTVTYMEKTATYNITVNEICTHECPVCGDCMDLYSTIDACSVKCGDERAESYTFQSENSRVVTVAGSRGPVSTFTDREDLSTGELVSGRGNFSTNTGASLTFGITVPKTTVATLLVRVSRGTGNKTVFTDVALPILSNAEGEMDVLSRSTIVEKTSTGTWFDFMEISLGDVTLHAGENLLKFAPTGAAYNFDYVAFLSDEVVTWSDGTPADIIGAPRFGKTGADANAEDITFENNAIGKTDVLTAEVATDINLKELTKSLSVNNTAIDTYTVEYNATKKVYEVSIDLSALGLITNDKCKVRFIGADSMVLSMGDFVYRKYGTNINTTAVDDSAWTKYEFTARAAAETEDLAQGVKISAGLNAPKSRANAKGFYPVGNLDGSKGKSITYYIESDKAVSSVGLYMELGNIAAQNTLRDWMDLTVNGNDEYYSDAAMPTGATYTPSNTYTLIGFIALQEGTNEITFTVNNTKLSTGHNFYGMQLTAKDAAFTRGTVPSPPAPEPEPEPAPES